MSTTFFLKFSGLENFPKVDNRKLTIQVTILGIKPSVADASFQEDLISLSLAARTEISIPSLGPTVGAVHP